MVKKILLYVVVLVFLGIVGAAFWYFHKQEEYRGANAFFAVPVDSELIINIPNLEQFIEQLNRNKGALKELQNIDEVEEMVTALNEIDSLANDRVSGNYISLKRSVSIATYLQGLNSVKLLYILPIIDYLDEQHIIGAIERAIAPKQLQVRNYEKIDIYSFNHFYFATVKGMFLASSSKILLETSIRQATSGKSIASNKGFKRINRTVGEGADAHLYVNVKKIPRLVSIFTSKNYKKAIKTGANLATWTALDLNIRDNVILLNGLTFSDIKERNYLNVFLKQKPIELQMEEVIPADAFMLSMFGFSDVKKFKKSYKKYLAEVGYLEEYEKQVANMKKLFGVSIEKLIYEELNNEVGLVYTAYSIEHPFTIIKTKSGSLAKDRLISAIDHYGKARNRELSYYSRKYRIYGATDVHVYRFPEEKLAAKLFGCWFNNASSKYFTFVDNYIVMGHTKELLVAYVKAIKLGKKITTDKNYDDSKEYLSTKTNFFFYANTPRGHRLFKQFMSESSNKKIEDYLATIDKFQNFGFQLSSTQDLIYNDLFISYNPVVEIPPQTVWESKLDTCFTHKPFLVKNHRDKSTEIFVQDEHNQIYLISSKGNILWKKPLNEKIIGDVKQIDCYRNNKLQYLFTTTKQLYLIDRNGKHVRNFPVPLPSNAVRGVAVFDYNNNKDYRIFVPCINKKVYVYSKKGELVKGWNPNPADNAITCDVQFFRVQNKDYLVYADRFRAYILNRKGKERVKLKKQFSKSTKNAFYLDKRSNQLITTDNAGVVYKIDFKGNVTSKSYLNLSPNHYFVVTDLTSNGRNEYIFADNNFIAVYQPNGKLLWKKTFKGNISAAPSIYRFSKKSKEVGVCIGGLNKIHLLNAKGKSHTGFPLKGNTKFSVGFTKKDDKGFHLFVGNNRNFLLNYDVK